jgi:hypothetical protein
MSLIDFRITTVPKPPICARSVAPDHFPYETQAGLVLSALIPFLRSELFMGFAHVVISAPAGHDFEQVRNIP